MSDSIDFRPWDEDICLSADALVSLSLDAAEGELQMGGLLYRLNQFNKEDGFSTCVNLAASLASLLHILCETYTALGSDIDPHDLWMTLSSSKQSAAFEGDYPPYRYNRGEE